MNVSSHLCNQLKHALTSHYTYPKKNRDHRFSYSWSPSTQHSALMVGRWGTSLYDPNYMKLCSSPDCLAGNLPTQPSIHPLGTLRVDSMYNCYTILLNVCGRRNISLRVRGWTYKTKIKPSGGRKLCANPVSVSSGALCLVFILQNQHYTRRRRRIWVPPTPLRPTTHPPTHGVHANPVLIKWAPEYRNLYAASSATHTMSAVHLQLLFHPLSRPLLCK